DDLPGDDAHERRVAVVAAGRPLRREVGDLPWLPLAVPGDAADPLLPPGRGERGVDVDPTGAGRLPGGALPGPVGCPPAPGPRPASCAGRGLNPSRTSSRSAVGAEPWTTASTSP